MVTAASPMPHFLPTQPVTSSLQFSEQPAADSSPARGVAIPSPMVGTFYRAPSPDAEPYVEVGSVVKWRRGLIVEAMKMMNEIQSEVRRSSSDDENNNVEYGQPLFLLEPL
jgi:biotin carboxyl carrier protein